MEGKKMKTSKLRVTIHFSLRTFERNFNWTTGR